MKATMRFVGCAMALALVPAVAGAQAKPPETTPPEKPAMQHDMSKMGKDTAVKQEMAGMAMGCGMKHKMWMMGKDSMMNHETMSAGWKEFGVFQKAFMETWYLAEKANFKSARERSAELVKAAEAWAESKGPATCDNASSLTEIPVIVADVKAFGDVVQNRGTDDAVKAALMKTHDSFEKVAMPCRMEGMEGMRGMECMKGMKGMPAPKKP
ncbi:MAG: hypothetical protein HY084_07885 [Gemmatimonadetes bacterium]|nr:hypothetical protein [Gemmatimonadota bacterium]